MKKQNPIIILILFIVIIKRIKSNNNIKIEPTKVMMDANFKWEASTAPRWTSAFLGTNDVFGRELNHAFCEEYRVLQDGKCSVLTNFALDKRNLLKVNQAMYPLA